jgi:hypothetical protein
VKPSWGAKASICAADGVPEDGVGLGAEEDDDVGRGVCGDAGLGEVEGEGEGTVGGCGAVPALIAAV